MIKVIWNRWGRLEIGGAHCDLLYFREAILPAKTEVVEETSGRVVMFSPIFRTSLHTFAQDKHVQITEAELQPVFEQVRNVPFQTRWPTHFSKFSLLKSPFQVIKIMAFCHSLGIIIRDLKPRKLVFDTEGRIRLHHVRDCVVLDDPNNDTVYEKFGSPAYVQPEVLTAGGSGYSGKAADMWSFGVLMYLLLLGRYPFFDKTPIGVLQRIMQARVSLPIACQLSKHGKLPFPPFYKRISSSSGATLLALEEIPREASHRGEVGLHPLGAVAHPAEPWQFEWRADPVPAVPGRHPQRAVQLPRGPFSRRAACSAVRRRKERHQSAGLPGGRAAPQCDSPNSSEISQQSSKN